MIISQTAKQMPLNAASMRRSDVANGLSRISPMLGGRQVAKYRCGITYSELEEFASVCCTASLTASADEYDRGGYFDANLVPHYYVADYLGSNIAVIRSDGTLVQSATYYPYGEPHRDPAASATIGIAGPEQQTASATFSNPYLYGDKEYVRRNGLREYIYGARMCVPSVTRFNSMDELCELRPWESPHLFCGGNPIRYIDPTGLIFTDNAILYAKELVAEAFSKMNNDDISKEDKEKYAQVIREIGSMLVSEQTFDVEVFGEEKRESTGVYNAPHTYYNMDNDAVTFAFRSYMFQENESNRIKNLRLGDTAHEFKHGYQFLNGELDLAASRGGILMQSKDVIYYDITDERAAYDREELFSGRHTSNQEIIGNSQYKKNGTKAKRYRGNYAL